MNNEINFTVDYSKVNLVWMILDAISTEITDTSSSLTTDMTNVLIEKLEKTKSEMTDDGALILKLTSGNKEVKDNADSSISKLNSFDSRNGRGTAVAPTKLIIDSYIGYPGLGYIASSPGLSSA